MVMQNSFLSPLGAPGSFFLNEDPRMAYFSFQDRFGQNPRQRSFYQDFFPQAHDEFLGLLGQSLRAGQLPSMQFTDFLQSFPFDQRYGTLPPAMRGGFMRGGQTGRFSPAAQFMFG